MHNFKLTIKFSKQMHWVSSANNRSLKETNYLARISSSSDSLILNRQELIVYRVPIMPTMRQDIQIYKILVTTKGYQLSLTAKFKLMETEDYQSLHQMVIKMWREMLVVNLVTKIQLDLHQEFRVMECILQVALLDLTLTKLLMWVWSSHEHQAFFPRQNKVY